MIIKKLMKCLTGISFATLLLLETACPDSAGESISLVVKYKDYLLELASGESFAMTIKIIYPKENGSCLKYSVV